MRRREDWKGRKGTREGRITEERRRRRRRGQEKRGDERAVVQVEGGRGENEKKEK